MLSKIFITNSVMNEDFQIPLNPPFSKGENSIYTPLWQRGVRGDF